MKIQKVDRIIESINKLTKSREFNQLTKIDDLSKFKTTPYHTWPESWKKVYYKAYPRFEQKILPEPAKLNYNLFNSLIKRISVREFSKKALSAQELSNILYYSAGLQRIRTQDKSERRTYPSAGARYPLEVYPFVFRSTGLDTAVYHYHLKSHSLELILRKPIFNRTMRQFDQPWIRKSAILLVITAVFDRTESKYKDRGYRHILTEYGHMAQNIYLISTALSLGCCSIGGFNDDGLNMILDINGIDESVIGVVAIGKRPQS